MLHSAPSFSIYNKNNTNSEEEQEEALARTVTIGDTITAIQDGVGGLSVENPKMGLIKEDENDEDVINISIGGGGGGGEGKEPISPPMYLAAGLGIDGFDFGGGGEFSLPLGSSFDEIGGGGGGDGGNDVEGYDKGLLDEYPSHPLLLRNYAKVLQLRGDLHEAEEYYHRASLADPEDSESLIEYAKLMWELHRDQETARINFEHAVQASPQDSNVLAAYASFLWGIDDDEEEQDASSHQEHIQVRMNGRNESETHERSIEPDIGSNLEEYYKRLVEENPDNSMVLRKYAQFLNEFKGDREGAEEYYSRAVMADPSDGESMSHYARLVWELHRDHSKAMAYFERSVQTSPRDSDVLAAYARFLWQTEEYQDKSTMPEQHVDRHESLPTFASATA